MPLPPIPRSTDFNRNVIMRAAREAADTMWSDGIAQGLTPERNLATILRILHKTLASEFTVGYIVKYLFDTRYPG